MRTDALDTAGLRAMLPLLRMQYEANRLAWRELLDGPADHGVAVEVNVESVARSQKAEFAVGPYAKDRAMRRDLVRLCPAMLPPDERPQLPLDGVERVAHGDVRVLVRVIVGAFSAPDDRRPTRDTELDPHLEQPALVTVVMRLIHHDAARDQVGVQLLEVRDSPADLVGQRLGRPHAVEGDLDRYRHDRALNIAARDGAAASSCSLCV